VVQASAKSTQAGQDVNNPDMEWVNLSDFQNGDALFQTYTENNKTGVSSAFRQALLLLGHIPSDLNRATAYAILSLIEKQVYGPLRNKFDWWVNNTLLPAIGITLIQFESLSPQATNIEEMSKSLEYGVKGGAFTPNMLLKLYGTWLNTEFDPIDAEWGDKPWAGTLAQINLDTAPPDDENNGNNQGGEEDDETDEGNDDTRTLKNRIKKLEKLVSDMAARQEKDADFVSAFGQGGE
jgi:capsid portal protein